MLPGKSLAQKNNQLEGWLSFHPLPSPQYSSGSSERVKKSCKFTVTLPFFSRACKKRKTKKKKKNTKQHTHTKTHPTTQNPKPQQNQKNYTITIKTTFIFWFYEQRIIRY